MFNHGDFFQSSLSEVRLMKTVRFNWFREVGLFGFRSRAKFGNGIESEVS